MRRIATSFVSMAVLLLLTYNTKAQTLTALTNTECNAVNFTGSYSEDFQSGSTTSLSGFIGAGWNKVIAGSAEYIQTAATSGNTYALTSPTFKDPTNPLYVKFTLAGSSQLVSYKVYYQTVASGAPVLIGTVVSSGGQQCLRINDLINVVGFNNPFRLVWEISTSSNGASGNGMISFDDFFIAGVTLNASVLPVKFGAFTAKKSAAGIQLNWTIDAEENTRGYEVERSPDGLKYASIGTVAATGLRSYIYNDASPIASAFYRIKAIDNDGKFGYSQVVRMKGTESSVEIRAFLSNQHTLTVQHDAGTAGARISVVTADGRTLKAIPVATGAFQTQVDIATAVPGLLIVRFEASNGKSQTLKLVKP